MRIRLATGVRSSRSNDLAFAAFVRPSRVISRTPRNESVIEPGLVPASGPSYRAPLPATTVRIVWKVMAQSKSTDMFFR